MHLSCLIIFNVLIFVTGQQPLTQRGPWKTKFTTETYSSYPWITTPSPSVFEVGGGSMLETGRIVSANMVTEYGTPFYECPNNYVLKGTECHQIDCPYETTTSGYTYTTETPVPRHCVINPTIIPTCPPNAVFENNKCRITEAFCPYGTVRVNNQCHLYVQETTFHVDFYCPAGTNKDVARRKCVYTPQVPEVVVECGSSFSQNGNICYFTPKPLNVRCPDDDLPQNGVCYVKKINVDFTCPQNTQKSFIDNTCEVIPKRFVCPNGQQLFDNTCKIDGTSPTGCPYGSVSKLGKCYITLNATYPGPQVVYECPHPFYHDTRENVCKVEFTEAFICPDGKPPVDGLCKIHIDNPDNYQIIMECPFGYEKVELFASTKCVYRPQPMRGTCERIISSKSCKRSSKCCSSPTVIHNNNTIHIPTNITSSNINYITIGSLDECKSGSSGGSCKQNTHVVDKKEKCCTVVTPRICENQNNQWECGHREYNACGHFCTNDYVHLKSAHPMYKHGILSMPPPTYSTKVNRRNYPVTNCNGCVEGRYDCSPECFDYDCEEEGCNFVDQENFCRTYHEPGCQLEDGYDMGY